MPRRGAGIGISTWLRTGFHFRDRRCASGCSEGRGAKIRGAGWLGVLAGSATVRVRRFPSVTCSSARAPCATTRLIWLAAQHHGLLRPSSIPASPRCCSSTRCVPARSARNGAHRDPAGPTAGGFSGALPAHLHDEPLPEWPPRQHLARLPLHAGCGGAIPARAPDCCSLPLYGSVGRREAFTACCASPARSQSSMALRPSRPLTSPKLVSTGAS